MKYFETIRCDDYEVFYLPYHQKRIARTIGKNIDLREYIYPPTKDLLRCKVIYDEGGIESVHYFPYTKKNPTVFGFIQDNTLAYSKKYCDRSALENLLKQKKSTDEIIIVQNGLVTDTSIANIALYEKGLWFTPKKPILLGTTRQRYLDAGVLHEANILPKQLKNASKIALLNAMIGFDEIKSFACEDL